MGHQAESHLTPELRERGYSKCTRNDFTVPVWFLLTSVPSVAVTFGEFDLFGRVAVAELEWVAQ